MRRILFLAAIFGAVMACGSLVGVKDLEVVNDGESSNEPETDAGPPDVELLPEASQFEVDDGIVVQPPVDAGCEASLFGTFAPTDFRFEGDNSNKMSWINDPQNVKAADNSSFVLQSFATVGGATVSRAVKFQGFKPFVPDNKRIVGLAVDLTGKSSHAGFFKDNDFRVKLNADGSITSANHLNATAWPTTFEKRTYGGPNTLWELENSLTPAAVNQPDFGVVYILQKPNNDPSPDFYLDAVSLTIYVCN